MKNWALWIDNMNIKHNKTEVVRESKLNKATIDMLYFSTAISSSVSYVKHSINFHNRE